MIRPNRFTTTLLALTLMGALAFADNATSSDNHGVSARYSVALVDVPTGAIGSHVLFTNSDWTAGNALSTVVTRDSTISYTLADGATRGTITAQLSTGDSPPNFGALRVFLRAKEAAAGGQAGFQFVAEPTNPGVALLAFGTAGTTGATTAQKIIETTVNQGVAQANLNLEYIFQIDVTKGPAFGLAALTVIFTATAPAP